MVLKTLFRRLLQKPVKVRRKSIEKRLLEETPKSLIIVFFVFFYKFLLSDVRCYFCYKNFTHIAAVISTLDQMQCQFLEKYKPLHLKKRADPNELIMILILWLGIYSTWNQISIYVLWILAFWQFFWLQCGKKIQTVSLYVFLSFSLSLSLSLYLFFSNINN